MGKGKTKEFQFGNDGDDDMRPTSKESDSRTSTSTPFGNLRNNLNSIDYEVKGNLNINDEVRNFLDSLKLNKYYKVFSDNGFEDLNAVLELNDENLTELNFPLGHKLKILKKIKEIKYKREVEEEEKKPIYDSSNMLPPRDVQAEQADYEILPYDEPSPERPAPKKKVTICTPAAVGGDDLISDLLSGDYDEEKMRQEFRAALGNWRDEIDTIIKQPLEEVKEVDEYPNEDEGWGVGFSVSDAQIGTDSKFKPVMITTTVQHRGGNVHEVTNYGPIDNPRITAQDLKLPKKVSWWNWYKLGTEEEFYLDENLTKYYFWQIKWIESYHSKYVAICPNDYVKFIKSEGCFSKGEWYWSEKWVDQFNKEIEAEIDEDWEVIDL